MRGAAIYSAPFVATGILRRKCFSDLNGGLPRDGEQCNRSAPGSGIHNQDMTVFLEGRLSLWLSSLNSYLYIC